MRDYRGKRLDNGTWVTSGSFGRMSDDCVNWDYFIGAGKPATHTFDGGGNLLEGVTEGDSYKDTWNRWHDIWNSTIDPADLPVYGWEANPWVWAIRFERCEKPQEVE